MSSCPSPAPGPAHGEGGAGYPGDAHRDRGAGLGRTRRERLRDLLLSSEDGIALDQIERLLEVKRHVAIRDLEHLRLSLRHREETLFMVPPSCVSCGFTFRLEAPKAPSRCPACKSRELTEPIFKAAANA